MLFWADHGWALGEHSMFCKQANFELQTRVPLLIRAPWLAAPATGRGSRALVELVDLLPTAIDLTGLRAGGVDISIDGPLGLEGFSLAPLLAEQPPPAAAWKRAAFSQYARVALDRQTLFWPCPWSGDQNMSAMCTKPFPACVTGVEIMSYSVRVEDWRYTWRVQSANRNRVSS